MISITVRLANGDEIEFSAPDTLSPWSIPLHPEYADDPQTYVLSDGTQNQLDSIYAVADALAK